MNSKSLIAIAVLALVGAVAGVQAEEKESEPESSVQAAPSDIQVPFDARGTFDLGFRYVDVNGNGNKYRSHLNYRTGPRLFNLDVDVLPGKSELFDLLNVRINNLGGDPYEFFAVTMKNYEKYNFRYERRKSNYFYQDILAPPAIVTPSLANVDFATWDFVRTNDLFGFDFRLTRDVKVFANFNHQTRRGESTTTLDISRDEFELDKPLDEKKDDYTVGVEVNTNKVGFYFDQTYRDYENNWHIFLPGASLGEDPEDATILFNFEQFQPYDLKMPQSTFRLNLRPDDANRWTINFAYIYGKLNSEIDYEELAEGIAFNGAPLNEHITGGGEIDRKINMADLDIIFSATDKVNIIGGARFHRFDQEAGFTQRSGLEVSPVETGWDISTGIYEVGVRTYPNPIFTVTGGIRYEKRDTIFIEEGEREKEPNTDRTTFFINGVYSPSTKANVLLEYERGDYDNPFTRVSPTSLDRFKTRVRYMPIPGLSIVGLFHLRNNENSISDGKFNTHNFTATVNYAVANVNLFGSYTRQDIDYDITNEVTTLPGFGGGRMYTWMSMYELKIDMGRGGLRYEFAEIAAVGGEFNVYKNKGSFALDWTMFNIFTEFTAPAGYLFRIVYQRNDYSEKAFNLDDYDANMLLLSVGYKF